MIADENWTMLLLDTRVRDLPANATLQLPVDWLKEQLETPVIENRKETGEEFEVDFTVGEVANAFGLSPSTVRAWCASGELDAYKLNGRQWRITKEGLSKYQEQQRFSCNASRDRQHARTAPASLGSWHDMEGSIHA